MSNIFSAPAPFSCFMKSPLRKSADFSAAGLRTGANVSLMRIMPEYARHLAASFVRAVLAQVLTRPEEANCLVAEMKREASPGRCICFAAKPWTARARNSAETFAMDGKRNGPSGRWPQAKSDARQHDRVRHW